MAEQEPAPKIGIALFTNAEVLDFTGPHQIFAYVAPTVWLSHDMDPVSLQPKGRVLPDMTYGECPQLDVVIVPGGIGQEQAMTDDRLLDFIRTQHKGGAIIASVCTGSLILAAAGLLEGRPATSNWMALGELGRMGARVVKQRVVDDGDIITGAGVSAGIDMAITLVARLYGEDMAKAVTLGAEYDPDPPYDTGHPDRADPEMVAQIRKTFRYED